MGSALASRREWRNPRNQIQDTPIYVQLESRRVTEKVGNTDQRKSSGGLNEDTKTMLHKVRKETPATAAAPTDVADVDPELVFQTAESLGIYLESKKMDKKEQGRSNKGRAASANNSVRRWQGHCRASG